MATRQPQAVEGTQRCRVTTPYLQGVHHQVPEGVFCVYGRKQAHDHDHKTCKWYAEDKAAFARAYQDSKLQSERQHPQGISEFQADIQTIVGLKESLKKMLISEKSLKEGMPQVAWPSTAAH